MTDLRARLADALRVEFARQSDYATLEYAVHRMTDVLLSLPGIAIVDTENVEQSAQALAEAIWEGSDAWDLLSEGERVNYRRWVKAVLLAAANAAEGQPDE